MAILRWLPIWLPLAVIARGCHGDTEEIKQSLRQILSEQNTARIELGIASQHLANIEEMLHGKFKSDETP